MAASSDRALNTHPDRDGLPLVPLPVGTQIIGDLHLDIANPLQVEKFCERLRALRGTPRLIILGDLFEYWVGPAQLDAAKVPVAAMLELAESGTAIDIIPGNRDFLLEERFERASGAVVRANGFVGHLPSGKLAAVGENAEFVLLIHGDELCTLDLPYQRLRRVLRSRFARGLAAATPGPIARGIAGRLRRASTKAIDYKPNHTMQQQTSACTELASRSSCRTLICGHAHHFRDERLPDGLRWLVVDAFGGERDTLLVNAEGRLQVLDEAT